MNTIRTNKYLMYPLVVLLLYFGVDRTCSSERMKMLTQRDAVFLYFDYKPQLIDEMEQVYRGMEAERKSGRLPYRRKLMLVLGSSRLMFFSYEQFARNFPDWELFNFSAPVTAPAYYAFILERVLERGIRPDYLLVETDPYQFNAGSEVFVRSNLAHSFDLRFVLSHWNRFSTDEISFYLARTLFSGYKYPPHLNHLRERLEDPKNARAVWLGVLDEHQKKNRGAGRSLVPRENWYETDFARLEGIARKDLFRMYSRYSPSDRQFAFLAELLGRARSVGASTLLIRPQVSRPAERLVSEDKELSAKMAAWERRLKAETAPFGARYVDLSRRPDFYCNTFFDASHMSLDCFHPMLVLVMREYEAMRASGSTSPAVPVR